LHILAREADITNRGHCYLFLGATGYMSAESTAGNLLLLFFIYTVLTSYAGRRAAKEIKVQNEHACPSRGVFGKLLRPGTQVSRMMLL
jgi:hypothetical protein